MRTAIRPERHAGWVWRHSLQRGAAMVEFVVVAPIITALGLAVLQYSMLFFAKGQVNHAAFMAARAGSVQHANIGSIRAAYKRALVPLYGGGLNSAELAQAAAKVEADLTPQTFRVEIINPTKESFDDYSDPTLTERFGARAIPNTALALRPDIDKVQPNSGQSLQDANLLKLRITHGYEPKVWLMGMMYKKYLQWQDTGEDAFRTQLIDNGRIPVVAHVTLAMQSEAVEQSDGTGGAVSASSPGPGNNGNPTDPGDPPSTDKPAPVCLTMGCSAVFVPSDPGDPDGNGDGAGSGGSGGSGGGSGGQGGSCLSGTLSADLLFDFDQSILTPAGKAALDKLVASLDGRSYTEITLTGYTDQLGTKARNQALSLARANAARDYLVSKGVPANKIKTQGWGSANPKVPLSSCPAGPSQISCLAPNRRVTYDIV